VLERYLIFFYYRLSKVGGFSPRKNSPFFAFEAASSAQLSVTSLRFSATLEAGFLLNSRDGSNPFDLNRCPFSSASSFPTLPKLTSLFQYSRVNVPLDYMPFGRMALLSFHFIDALGSGPVIRVLICVRAFSWNDLFSPHSTRMRARRPATFSPLQSRLRSQSMILFIRALLL